MTARSDWRAIDRRAYDMAMRALDYVAGAASISVVEPPLRNAVLLAVDEAKVGMGRIVSQFTVHTRLEIESARETVFVTAPHDVPRLRDAACLATIARGAAAAMRAMLDATTVYDGSKAFETGVAPMRHALKIHVARALAETPCPHSHPSPSVASGSITFSGRPKVTMRMFGTGPSYGLDVPEGVDPFPMPPFDRVAHVTKSNTDSGHVYVRAAILPVAITAAMTRLPADAVEAVRLMRDATAPVLMPSKARS